MTGRYRSTFLIPLNAHRVLGDSGWEFFSTRRIPQHQVALVIKELGFVESSAYLGMTTFSGVSANATILLDEQGQAEHIFFRAYANRDIRGELVRALGLLDEPACLEVFSPDA